MTLVATPEVLWPNLGTMGNTTAQHIELDAAGEAGGFVMEAPDTATIKGIRFGTGTVTTSGSLDFVIEGVDLTTGFPNGTDLGGGSPTSVNVAIANTLDNSTGVVTFTNTLSVTRGDIIAVTFTVPTADAFDGRIRRIASGAGSGKRFPYALQDVGGAGWAHVSNSNPAITLIYSDDSLHLAPGCASAYGNVSSTLFNTTDTYTEYGIKFQVPFPCRVTGAWSMDEAENQVSIQLYSSAGHGSPIASTNTIDTNLRNNTNAPVNPNHYQFLSAVELAKDTDYRLMLKAESTTDTRNTRVIINAADREALFGSATILTGSKYEDGVGFDDTDTDSVWFVGLIIDQLDDGTGGGGGQVVNGGLVA